MIFSRQITMTTTCIQLHILLNRSTFTARVLTVAFAATAGVCCIEFRFTNRCWFRRCGLGCRFRCRYRLRRTHRAVERLRRWQCGSLAERSSLSHHRVFAGIAAVTPARTIGDGRASVLRVGGMLTCHCCTATKGWCDRRRCCSGWCN